MLSSDVIFFGIIGIICVGALIVALVVPRHIYKDYDSYWWKAKDKWK